MGKILNIIKYDRLTENGIPSNWVYDCSANYHIKACYTTNRLRRNGAELRTGGNEGVLKCINWGIKYLSVSYYP